MVRAKDKKYLKLANMEDELIYEILKTKLWVLCSACFYNHEFILNSNMRGFSRGRYRMEIKKLKRKVEGKAYKVEMYWTPYNPDNKVYVGRVGNYNELIDVIKKVNKDLLDTERAYD